MHTYTYARLTKKGRLGLGSQRLVTPGPALRTRDARDLIHIDVKKLARSRKVGQLFHGQPAAWPLDWRGLRVGPCRHRRRHTAGLAYVEVLADEQQATAIGRLYEQGFGLVQRSGCRVPSCDVG